MSEETYVWIARDKPSEGCALGLLCMYGVCPEFDAEEGYYFIGDEFAYLPPRTFPEITFETGPIRFRLERCEEDNDA